MEEIRRVRTGLFRSLRGSGNYSSGELWNKGENLAFDISSRQRRTADVPSLVLPYPSQDIRPRDSVYENKQSSKCMHYDTVLMQFYC